MAQLATLISAKISAAMATLKDQAGTPTGLVFGRAGSARYGTTIDELTTAIESAVAGMFGGTIKVITGITGADVDTGMTATGVTTADEVIMAIGDTGGTPTDVTSETSITDANEIQCTTTDHTAKTLTLFYVDADGSEL